MMALAPEDFADLRRWAICGAVVLFAHGGVGAAMVTWREPPEGIGAAGGFAIKITPVPMAPPTSETELPPGPEQDLANTAPSKLIESPEEKAKTEQKVEAKIERKVEERVESKPVEELPPEVAPAPNPEVAIEPPPPREVKEETPPPQEASPSSVAMAPHVIAEEAAEVPSAPRPGAPNPYDSPEARTWKAQILAMIQRNKRYPASARARGEKGVAKVSFTLDRQGRLIESRITSSSGVAALDEEALALLRRIQPFPVMPGVFTDDRMTVSFPLNFDLK